MFKYCPNCKAELSTENNHLFCNCGFDYYIGPNPAVAVIFINNKNQIYLGRRSREPKKGFWDLPGGFIDFKESAEEAARREIKEELGIELVDINYFCSYSNDYFYKGTQYYPLDLFFIAKVELDEINPIEKEEFIEGKFFNLNEVPSDKLAFKSQKQALEKYIESVKEK